MSYIIISVPLTIPLIIFCYFFVINNFKKCNFFSLLYAMADNSNFYVLALHLPNCFKKFSKSFSCAPSLLLVAYATLNSFWLLCLLL